MDLAISFIITINNHAKPLVLGYFRFHERIRFSDFDCRAIVRLQVLRSVSVRSLIERKSENIGGRIVNRQSN